jgi:acyl-CoA synthetase (AMP-forming)/AMP-acid ligase II
MLYYWGRPEATADVLHHGWLTVGDLGYIDADGYVWIVSRDSDVINSGGFNVYASEVERVIAAVPGVRAVAVLGEPDEVLGERVVAIIEAAAGSGLAAADIEAACVRGLARYKRPAVIRFVSELAVDDMGKVRKHLLHRS